MRRLQATLSREAAACPETIDTGEIINWQYLRDGSMIELYQIPADDGTISPENIPTETLAFERFDPAGEYVYVYHRSTPNEIVDALIEVIDTYNLVIELPIVFDDRGVTVSLLGETEHLQAAYDVIPEPIKAQTTVERLTSFSPVARGLHAELTPRQRQLLDAAISVDYYSVPREATVADVAEVADCAPSTAAEHLRKLESRVFSTLADA
ncbi:helix-turn-helix domain-containing protein [Halosolutus halophilus]|uniref:helix-turn-helix domain-containing protein n=1 Tax=Halosolutus halophilus TaxID=1552990 RepID=UPI002234FAA6|nr:helix-turn-helix domain-containing protein [Halosolutus halophilus]